MIAIFFLFAFAHCANPSFMTTLEELQATSLQLLKSRKSDEITIDISVVEKASCKDILTGMASMDDFFFILFWYSYGQKVYLFINYTGCRFIKKLSKKHDRGGPVLFGMKNNFEKFLKEKLLKELLAPTIEISIEDKELLLSEAMALYYGKFQSIWMRIARPCCEKFDSLNQTFSEFRKVISVGIYGSLNHAFGDITRNLDNPEKVESVYSSKKHFSALAKLLASDEKENWGWRWISEQENPYFIISFFAFQEFIPAPNYSFLSIIREDKEKRWWAFEHLLEILKKRVNFKFIQEEKKLKFDLNFRNPIPSHIITDEEMKMIISKIVLKLFNFCHIPNK
jgi:hypothetical protein